MMQVGSREIIREAVAQNLGVAAVSEVEFVPGPGLHAVRLADAQVRTYVHMVCLAERRDARIVRALFDVVGRSEEHTSELQSLMRISYAVFCLKKKIKITQQ